ncbi:MULTISPECIES: PAS domain-containing protein [unclassified Haloarcula]|uniref:PAS domain-containing protein n=1 Tax=unclassified Haloarcula TaxID=2624677 RepID=UPI001CD98534|nr:MULTISPECIES: PAS domain-containing protein [unclassified Haloarcula]
MSETAATRFEALFEHTDDAVAEAEFVDGEPIIRVVNPAFVELFGVDGRTTLTLRVPLVTEFAVSGDSSGRTSQGD